MNKFCVLGRLRDDPEVKEIENGSKVANIILAVDRDYKDKDGNKITDFLRYSLWNKDAERLEKLSKQGALIQLEGHCTTKKVEGKEGPLYVMQPIVDSYKHIENVKRIENETDEELQTENEVEK